MKRLLLLFLCLAPLTAFAVDDDLILVGVAVRTRPDFDGSNSRTTELIPVLRYYGKTLFARTTQGVLEGGARVEIVKDLHVGLQLGYEDGPRNKDPGASVGAHAEWDYKIGPTQGDLLVRYRQFVDSDRGAQMDVRGSIGVLDSGRALAAVFLQLTFANAENTRAYYGVDEPGLLYTNAGILGTYNLSRHWDAVGSLHMRWLSDDIVRTSPFVERKTGAYASAGIAYRF
jgi:outer membrane scaffolding protein for murein synthesis (MipA/OmpV family)